VRRFSVRRQGRGLSRLAFLGFLRPIFVSTPPFWDFYLGVKLRRMPQAQILRKITPDQA
jgi:hypothetical protein